MIRANVDPASAAYNYRYVIENFPNTPEADRAQTLLARIPEWTVDYSKAELTKGIDTRGWEKLPVTV